MVMEKNPIKNQWDCGLKTSQLQLQILCRLQLDPLTGLRTLHAVHANLLKKSRKLYGNGIKRRLKCHVCTMAKSTEM